MKDPYKNLSEKEMKELYEDMEADYWVSYEKSNCDQYIVQGIREAL